MNSIKNEKRSRDELAFSMRQAIKLSPDSAKKISSLSELKTFLFFLADNAPSSMESVVEQLSAKVQAAKKAAKIEKPKEKRALEDKDVFPNSEAKRIKAQKWQISKEEGKKTDPSAADTPETMKVIGSTEAEIGQHTSLYRTSALSSSASFPTARFSGKSSSTAETLETMDIGVSSNGENPQYAGLDGSKATLASFSPLISRFGCQQNPLVRQRQQSPPQLKETVTTSPEDRSCTRHQSAPDTREESLCFTSEGDVIEKERLPLAEVLVPEPTQEEPSQAIESLTSSHKARRSTRETSPESPSDHAEAEGVESEHQSVAKVLRQISSLEYEEKLIFTQEQAIVMRIPDTVRLLGKKLLKLRTGRDLVRMRSTSQANLEMDTVFESCRMLKSDMVRELLLEFLRNRLVSPGCKNETIPATWDINDPDEVYDILEGIDKETSDFAIHQAFGQMKLVDLVDVKASKTPGLTCVAVLHELATRKAGRVSQKEVNSKINKYTTEYHIGRKWHNVVSCFGGPGTVLIFVVAGIGISKITRSWTDFQRRCFRHLSQYLLTIKAMVRTLGPDALQTYCRNGCLPEKQILDLEQDQMTAVVEEVETDSGEEP